MKHKLKVILVESEGNRKKPVIKKDIISQQDAIETFRGILQEYYGVPPESILKKFTKPIGYDE